MAAPPTPATPAAQALLGALADRPGATASELAEAARIGRSTATKLLATLAANRQVQRQPGGHQGGRRTADRWTLSTPAVTRDAGASSAATSAAAAEQPPTASKRLRPGALRDLVLACLAERPGQTLSPTAIATILGRSAGAVDNALQILAGQGAVTQTQAKPRRYTIANPTSNQADTTS
jgi:DNA-binding MarR family transcriptional regulator